MSIDACDANGRDSIACRARVPRLLLDGAEREPGDDVALLSDSERLHTIATT